VPHLEQVYGFISIPGEILLTLWREEVYVLSIDGPHIDIPRFHFLNDVLIETDMHSDFEQR
jgi:hypothetical protein